MFLHTLMARIFVQTARSYICTEGFSFITSAICAQKLNTLSEIKRVADVTVFHGHYVRSTHLLLSARRNYKTTRKLSHLTVEEQFILRVSSISSLLVLYIDCFILPSQLNGKSVVSLVNVSAMWPSKSYIHLLVGMCCLHAVVWIQYHDGSVNLADGGGHLVSLI